MEGSTLRARRPDRSHDDPAVRLNYDQEHDLPPPVYTAERNTLPAALEAEQYEQEYGTDKRNVNKDVHKQPTHLQFFGGMKSVWMTKNTEQIRDDAELKAKTIVREGLVYILFVIVISVLVFSMASTSMFYFTKVIGDLFLTTAPTDQKKFYEIQTTDEIWEYMQNQFLNALYWDEKITKTNYSDRSMIFFENRLLGYPRIRMLRVSNKSCEVVHGFRREVLECFSSYDEPKEERRNESSTNRTAFSYRPDSDLQSEWVWGQVSSYGGGGYVQELSINNKNESAQLIADLRQNRWLARGTRAIIVDFSMYNANMNLFCVVQLIFEMPATGGVFTMSSVNTLRLIRYVNFGDYVVLAFEAVFCAYVLYYIIEKFIEIIRMKLSFFTDFWNLLDLIVIGLAITYIILSIRRTLMIREKVGKLLTGPYQYENLQSIVYAENRCTEMLAILVYFAYLKIFKYVSFNKTMTQLSATLSRASKDIGGFGIMFGIIFFAYVQFGYLAFGCQIAEYSTLYNACFTLLRTILGDFDFSGLSRANRVLGPTFFLTYIFLVFFVLLNMFLAIINDAYSEVKSEFKSKGSEFEVQDYVAQRFYKFLRFFRRDRPVDAQKIPDYDTYKNEMIRKGFSNEEIDEHYLRHGMEEGAPTDQIMYPAEKKKAAPSVNDELMQQFLVLNRRVNGLEQTVANVSERLDLAASSFEKDIAKVTQTGDDNNKNSIQVAAIGAQHERSMGAKSNEKED
ncbi:hypothetical protein QR680_002599 [Steinernema hermaphroditum]|uniref:Polycystin cation channel PKD1/PKD2 domain-containing protein n=1 Tax=Steinernema hermaphroditum TaxID=289476 RepID=A0AA39LIN4_9BILA|nr:hypothetical protein QR680_002599 [Steinernema hermaphroditum]